MLTFKRGGMALPLGGLLITLVGVVLTFLRLRMGDYGGSDLAASICCFVFGLGMLFFFARVEIHPNTKVVKLFSGLRMAPRRTVHEWEKFDAVVAFEPANSHGGNSTYSLYLRETESQERSVLIQQYTHLEDMHRVAKEVSQLMDIPAIKEYRDEMSELT